MTALDGADIFTGLIGSIIYSSFARRPRSAGGVGITASGVEEAGNGPGCGICSSTGSSLFFRRGYSFVRWVWFADRSNSPKSSSMASLIRLASRVSPSHSTDSCTNGSAATFGPTCSEYSLQAVKRGHGIRKGLCELIDRIGCIAAGSCAKGNLRSRVTRWYVYSQ